MDKLSPGEAFWLGILAIFAGPLLIWFPFSAFEVAHRLMSGSETVVLLKLIGVAIFGWGYIGWGIGAIIFAFFQIDDFERHNFAIVFVLFWFILTFFAAISLAVSYFVHMTFHIGTSTLIIAWLLSAILATLIVIACRIRATS